MACVSSVQQPSHIALKFYHQFDFFYQADSSSSLQANMTTIANQVDLSWYPNTMMTHHLTFDLNNLTL